MDELHSEVMDAPQDHTSWFVPCSEDKGWSLGIVGWSLGFVESAGVWSVIRVSAD